MIKADLIGSKEVIIDGDVSVLIEEFKGIVAYMYEMYTRGGEKNIPIFYEAIKDGIVSAESIQKDNIEYPSETVSEEYLKEIEEIIKGGRTI